MSEIAPWGQIDCYNPGLGCTTTSQIAVEMEQKDPKGSVDTPDDPSASCERDKPTGQGKSSISDEMPSTAGYSRLLNDSDEDDLTAPRSAETHLPSMDELLRSRSVQGHSGASGIADPQHHPQQESSTGTATMPPKAGNFGVFGHDNSGLENSRQLIDYTAESLFNFLNSNNNQQLRSSQAGGDALPNPWPARPSNLPQQSLAQGTSDAMRSNTVELQGPESHSFAPVPLSPKSRAFVTIARLDKFRAKHGLPSLMDPRVGLERTNGSPPPDFFKQAWNFGMEARDNKMKAGWPFPAQASPQPPQPIFPPQSPYAVHQSSQLGSSIQAQMSYQDGLSRSQTSTPKSTATRSTSGKKNSPPYHCQHCPMSFGRPSNLLVHNRTHSGERPFKCSECKKAFSTSSNMKRHQRKLHPYLFTPEELAMYGRSRRSAGSPPVRKRQREGSDETLGKQEGKRRWVERAMDSSAAMQLRLMRNDRRMSNDETSERSQSRTITSETADPSQLDGESEPFVDEDGEVCHPRGWDARNNQGRRPRHPGRGNQ